MQHPEYRHTSSINADGSRIKVRVADVKGRFQVAKTWVYSLLMILFAAAPFLSIGTQRLVLLDIERRQFFLFGFTFNAQDTYLLFFIVTGLAFTLFFVTAIWGRIWCGWSCPQTVLMDGFFRRVERWIEGPRSEQLKLAQLPWKGRKLRLWIAKHFLFVLFSLLLSIILVAYFVPTQSLSRLIFHGTSAHPVLTLWIVGLTLIIYLDFSWFREQVCVIVCPYGRLQSLLTDDDSLVIGYDESRGEPRGKKNDPSRGDCIDCDRCVVVCPTGIDIRNGLQLDCIGCANCIDACDEVMERIGQPKGLVRYDSLNGLAGRKTSFWRSRIWVYAGLLIVGMGMFGAFLNHRNPFEANVLRLVGSPYTLTHDTLRNQFEIHLFNKQSKPANFLVSPQLPPYASMVLPIRELRLESFEDRRLPLFVEIPTNRFEGAFPLSVDVTDQASGVTVRHTIQFLGPN